MDLSFVLIGLPIAFLLGWLASRVDLRQLRFENRQAPKAYFKGLNFLLNEQQDQAIDAFIEAVQLDPDTSELHFALGNLFRKRGEYDRAVRVHEHLIGRADLSQLDRDRARYALAMDFLRAGILDRAETVLQQLSSTSYSAQAHLALLSIYERTREWKQAAVQAKALQDSGVGSFDVRLAHYLCEQAQSLVHKDADAAEQLLRQAVHTAPKADRPILELALLLEQKGQPQASYDLLLSLVSAQRPGTALAAPGLARLATTLGLQTPARQCLTQAYAHIPSLDVLEALANLSQQDTKDSAPSPSAQDLYLNHLGSDASLIAAERWIQLEQQSGRPIAPAIEQAIKKATRPLRNYRCAACGFETQHHYWNCPGCQAWDSYPPRRVEEL